MFREGAEAPFLSEGSVEGICISLNTPVLNIEGFPVGPARAAVVLYCDSYGSRQLVVGVASLSGHRVTYFDCQETLNEHQRADVALEIGLSHGEGLGFLFDDEVVSRHGSAEALRRWKQCVNEPDTEGLLDVALDEDGADLEDLNLLGDDGGDLVIEESSLSMTPEPGEAFVLEEVDLDVGTGAAAAPPSRPVSSGESRPLPEARPAAPVAAAPQGQVPLSKFRNESEELAVGAQAGSPSELGRIPIVRMRQGDSTDRPGFLARLLGSF